MRELRTRGTLFSCGLALAVMLHYYNSVAGAQKTVKQMATQVKQDDVKRRDAKQELAAPSRKKPRGRLPNYFGKIGISAQQREQIYDIQQQYLVKLEALEKQLQSLREMQDRDIQAVLTDNQKSLLERLVENFQQRLNRRGRKVPATVKKPDDVDKQ